MYNLKVVKVQDTDLILTEILVDRELRESWESEDLKCTSNKLHLLINGTLCEQLPHLWSGVFICRQHRAGGAREKSADSIYWIFKLKPHTRLKDGEERAESQTSRRSGEHAQSHITAIFPLALLDNDVVDSRRDVSTWKQK